MATDTSSPPRFFHMPRFQHQAPRQLFYKRPDFAQQQAMQQLTFDGKRMRKAVNRKTIDYNPSVIRHLEGLQTITNYKGKPSHKLPSDATLPDELNAFYARFEANMEPCMRAPPVPGD